MAGHKELAMAGIGVYREGQKDTEDVSEGDKMKKCPYCAEEIQDDALKCSYCGEFLDKKPPDKWYFKTGWLIIAFLSIGPLALPLVWFNPRFNRKKKIIISIIIVFLSYWLGIIFGNSLKNITKYYQQLFREF